ncbi:DUF924 family protein [Sneathiella sp.]|uniref:DUF924 family protein n=1 Tax=Sneathiella sp. TaxID=1964365 RepID=UPI00356186F0
MASNRIQDIIEFWFLPETNDAFGKPRAEWFEKNSEFDAEIRNRFNDDFESAISGRLLSWTECAKGSLALILLFDQFTRNMFRDDARAFSADGKARELARHMLSSGQYNELAPIYKSFALLPFEHSEDMEDQKLSVKLFTELGNDGSLDYAQRHYDIIKQFGRFPHRNKILGRQNTPAEEAFLKQPNSSF